MSNIPGNLFLLGITISISFFAFGVHTSRSRDKSFECFFYLLIAALSTCITARWSLETISFYQAEYSLPPEFGWVIALIGLMVGMFSSFALTGLRPVGKSPTQSGFFGWVLLSTVTLVPSVIYMYVARGVLSPFIGIVDDGKYAINSFILWFALFVLLNMVSLLIHAMHELCKTAKEAFAACDDKRIKKDYLKFIDFKKELNRREAKKENEEEPQINKEQP